MRIRSLLVLAAFGCAADPTELPPFEEAEVCQTGAVDHPQALAFDGDHLLVASTGYGIPWGPGRLAVFDLGDGSAGALRATAVLPTSWQNPQALVRAGDGFWLADSGLYDFTTGEPRMATPGGLDHYDGTALTGHLLGHHAQAGGPVDLVVVGERIFVTSGISQQVYLFDLESKTWLRGLADPITYGRGLGLGALATDGERVLVVDYNADRLHVLDGRTGALGCSVDLGETAELEGAKAPAVADGYLYYLLDQAGVLRRVPLDTLDDCVGATPETVAVTGLLPNHLLAHGEHLYLVHSGDNNVVALRRDDFSTAAIHVLSPGSNPWHVVAHPERPLLAVTEWAVDGVTLIDLTSGHQQRLRCGAEAPAPDPVPDQRGTARLADELRVTPSAGPGPYGDPTRAVNGVRGGGTRGSLDVFSLGTTPEVDAHMVACWSGPPVHDGPGPDFAVFENPFPGFVDPVVVEVSTDGEKWVAMPHDYRAEDETVYEPNPASWKGFAGISPVWLHEEDHPVDPLGTAAGGDAFDLAELDPATREAGIRCVRLTSAQARINPDTGQPFPVDPISDGADIDGIYGRR